MPEAKAVICFWPNNFFFVKSKLYLRIKKNTVTNDVR